MIIGWHLLCVQDKIQSENNNCIIDFLQILTSSYFFLLQISFNKYLEFAIAECKVSLNGFAPKEKVLQSILSENPKKIIKHFLFQMLLIS